jgi:hypothetical protein
MEEIKKAIGRIFEKGLKFFSSSFAKLQQKSTEKGNDGKLFIQWVKVIKMLFLVYIHIPIGQWV